MRSFILQVAVGLSLMAFSHGESDSIVQLLERMKAEFASLIQETTTPAGSVLSYTGLYEPLGWLFCDGRNVSRVQYGGLFGIVGTRFGSGDGTTTFRLPDYRERFLLGAASFSETGTAGGEATVALSLAEMPSHTHGLVLLLDREGPNYAPAIESGTGKAFGSTTNTGEGQAHNNMPPFFKVGWIVKI